MEQLKNFLTELEEPVFFEINIIVELNWKVHSRIQKILSQSQNKMQILVELTKFGMEIELGLKNNSTSLVQTQVSMYSGLFTPIYLRLKDICFGINNEIVQDIKSTMKNITGINISTTIKNYYLTRYRDIPFEDFGIGIKVSPNQTKEYLENQLEVSGLIGLFAKPTDKIMLKKYDRIWNALYSQNVSDVLNESAYVFVSSNEEEKILHSIQLSSDKKQDFQELEFQKQIEQTEQTEQREQNDMLQLEILKKNYENKYVIQNDLINKTSEKLVVVSDNILDDECENDENDESDENAENNDLNLNLENSAKLNISSDAKSFISNTNNKKKKKKNKHNNRKN